MRTVAHIGLQLQPMFSELCELTMHICMHTAVATEILCDSYMFFEETFLHKKSI